MCGKPLAYRRRWKISRGSASDLRRSLLEKSLWGEPKPQRTAERQAANLEALKSPLSDKTLLKTLPAAFQQGDFWCDNQTLRKSLTVVRLPRMSRKILFLLLLFIAAPCYAGTRSSDATVEVPFVFEKGYLLVQARIKNDIPVEMTIATGAEYSIVDVGLLDKYKLQANYAGEGPITGHNDRIFTFSPVSDVRLGAAKTRTLNMRLGLVANISKVLGREIFGALGVDFFKGSAVQIDFEKRVLRFLSESEAQSLTEKAGANKQTAQLKIAYNDDSFEHLPVPLVDVTIEGKKIKTLIDTGAVVIVALSQATAKKIGSTVSPGASSKKTKVQNLSIGGLRLNDVPAVVLTKENAGVLQGSDAVIGIAVLQNYLITFDFRRNLIVVEAR
jgi:predicted aspartyl protease